MEVMEAEGLAKELKEYKRMIVYIHLVTQTSHIDFSYAP